MKKTNESSPALWDINPIWQSLTEEERKWVGDQVEVLEIAKNAIIHEEGERADYMWMLAEGKVRIYKEGIGQRAQIIRLLKPYDFFGYRAVIAGDTYTSFASAFEPCKVYRLHRDIFLQLLQQNIHFCYQMLNVLARDLAVSEVQTVNLTQKHIRGRLAESLLTLRKKYGFDEDGCTLSLYMSREDLANMSNMTTSNAIRTLSQFAGEGLVSVDGRKIRILNEETLKTISRMG